jgi:aldose 1-epimerase
MGGVEALDTRGERIRLARGRAVAEIAPAVGGRVASLVVDGWDLIRRDGWTDNEWGAFVMAPWVGRMRDAGAAWGGRTWKVPANEPPHALHGLVAATPWDVAMANAGMVQLERSFGPDWPSGGRIVHAISLAHDRLVLRLQVHAELEPTPVILGWHPWFRRTALRMPGVAEDRMAAVAGPPDVGVVETGPVELVIDAQRRVELDGSGLPTGALLEPAASPLDDVLLDVTSAPVVRWPGGPSLTLHASGVAAWIAYTAHPDGVCVEPVTGLPDGINGGPLGEPPVARPGHPIEATFEIAWD